MRELRFEDYVDIVEVIEETEIKTDNLGVPAKNLKVMLAELNVVWRKVVGESIGNVSRVVGTYGYRLTVEVSHPVYANELNLLADVILKKISLELEKINPSLSKLDLRNGILFRVNPNLGVLYLENPV